jgi:hypothetical protein
MKVYLSPVAEKKTEIITLIDNRQNPKMVNKELSTYFNS